MDGITILNQTMIYDWPTWRVIVTIVMVAVIALCITAIMDNGSGIWGLLALVTFFGLIIIGVIGPEVETGLYKYEAIIDEDVSFTELYERYEIVNQRGEIYILRDKEVQE